MVGPIVRVAFTSLFDVEPATQTAISKFPLSIRGTTLPRGTRFRRGFKFGGLDVSAHIGSEVEVRQYCDFFQVIGFLSSHGDAVSVIDCRRPTKLYKFGSQKYLDLALDHGAFRMSSASSYLKYTDDPARHDDERERKRVGQGLVRVLDTTAREPRSEVKLFVPVTRRTRVPDYYFFSLACEYDVRLFERFKNSDCCLEIDEPKVFIERMQLAFEALMTGWIGADLPVVYGETHILGVPFYKDRRFGEQQEYRLAWMLPNWTGPDSLKPVQIELGSLREIASLRKKP